MNRLDILIRNEKDKHKGETYYSYSANDLIQQDLIEHKELIEMRTITELSDEYGISYGRIAKILRTAEIKVKRIYKTKGERKIKLPKMSEEEHKIALWASSFNNGKIRYVYYDMIRRCYKQDDRGYSRYGARGITVCDEWRKDCKNFYKWAKENGYDKGLQIDRIDNDKGYNPDNCHWVSPRENCMNRSCTRRVTLNGETHTLKDWAEITGISYQVLSDRIYRYGWTVERALTTK